VKEKLEYHHWLKFELIEFCKKNELITVGNKIQLKERIETFFYIKKNEVSNTLLKNKRRTIRKI
jgi:hypothetical protein